MTPSQQQA